MHMHMHMHPQARVEAAKSAAWAADRARVQGVVQAAAMEARAAQLGRGNMLRYLYPSPGPTTDCFLNASDLRAAEKLVPRIDAQLVASVHVGTP